MPCALFFCIRFGFEVFLLIYLAGEFLTTVFENTVLFLSKELKLKRISIAKNVKNFTEKGIFGMSYGFVETGFQFFLRYIITLFFGTALLGKLVISFQILNIVNLVFKSIVQSLSKELVGIISLKQDIKIRTLSFPIDTCSLLGATIVLIFFGFMNKNIEFAEQYLQYFDKYFLMAVCLSSFILPYKLLATVATNYQGRIRQAFKIKTICSLPVLGIMFLAGFFNSWLIFCLCFAAINFIECFFLSKILNSKDLLIRVWLSLVPTIILIFILQFLWER